MTSPAVSAASPARRREIARLAEQVRLPFRSRAWRGAVGSWQGRGQGSSVDFQDHRAYMPGDDPRHLDWAAYARTNHYTMKLFREEVSPRLDLALDVSRSMSLTEAKEQRALDLFALTLGIALRDGLSVRVYALHSAGQWRRHEAPAAARFESLHAFGLLGESGGHLPLGEVPWRAGSLRVLISDLLMPEPPERELAQLGRDHGAPVIFAPFLQEEAEPGWRGNLELVDCETSHSRRQRVEPYLISRYHENYRRHFELWQEEARRRSVPLARIACESPLGETVRRQALATGAFEVRH